MVEERPFLSIPPFPKRRHDDFIRVADLRLQLTDEEADLLAATLAAARVGGNYWSAQPALPPVPYILDRDGCGGTDQAAAVHWPKEEDFDPWHMLSGALALHCRADDPLYLIAGLAGVAVRLPGDEQAERISPVRLRTLLRDALGAQIYLDPFSGKPLSWAAVIELCAAWRQLIDANRDIAAVYGFAGWKRATTAPLLWDGALAPRYDLKPESLPAGMKAAVWKSRTSPSTLATLEAGGVCLIDVEDGFLRSAGLGANCVPPQSIVVDDLGAHFDGRSPSRLERLLQEGEFTADLVARAAAIRRSIVALGLSKYDSGQEPLSRRSPRLHVLVPGQVEDDRAVLSTPGRPLANLELLKRVRANRPDAYLIYKPHPDVEAGHRTGALPDAGALVFADEVVREPSISSWIDLVEEVHVNSSLAGFEALLRHKRVTTYGVPFYAGWGLTDDQGSIPARRTARRTLDELVTAALIIYPRYVDPVTNLPCSPEVLIARLSSSDAAWSSRPTFISTMRSLYGRLTRMLPFLRR